MSTPFLSREAIVSATQNQVSADLSADEKESVIILGLADGVYYELKNVGARVWSLITQPRSVEDILQAILEEYDVGEAQCLNDLAELFEDLKKRGLVELKSP